MQVWNTILATALAAALTLAATAVDAQQPVCPQASAEQLYLTTCRSDGRMAAALFLSNFTIDHFFKVSPPPFRRKPIELVAPLARAMLKSNEDLAPWLDSLPDLKFTKLDTSTGTFSMDIDEEQRWLETISKGWGQDHGLAVSLPKRLEGGYWRTPSVLQMAFWEGHRISFKIKPSRGEQIGGELECISISTDSIRFVVDGPGKPDFLIKFGNCL
jgi:hypothetical protein